MRLILFIFATCIRLAAQGQTWIVDYTGGGQFKDIQPAVNASSEG